MKSSETHVYELATPGRYFSGWRTFDSIPYVTEWRRFLLALFGSDLVKQIFNDQTSKVQLFTEFITDILYIHDVSSL